MYLKEYVWKDVLPHWFAEALPLTLLYYGIRTWLSRSGRSVFNLPSQTVWCWDLQCSICGWISTSSSGFSLGILGKLWTWRTKGSTANQIIKSARSRESRPLTATQSFHGTTGLWNKKFPAWIYDAASFMAPNRLTSQKFFVMTWPRSFRIDIFLCWFQLYSDKKSTIFTQYLVHFVITH